MTAHSDYFAHDDTHYSNDSRQATFFLALIALAAILSVVMLIWAVMV